MAVLLKEFNKLFRDNVLYILWKQWTSLGVSSNVQEERNKIIDIESLLITTFILGDYDKRLFSASVEWLLRNNKWINISRLKRIGKSFNFQKDVFNNALTFEDIIGLLQNSKNGEILDKYQKFFKKFRKRGIIADFAIKKPMLLQLRLRKLFGMNARAEIMIYLLSKESGNSLSISREIFYDQKIVYRILEDWVKAGITEKRKGKDYYITRRKEWLKLLDLQKMPVYINFAKVFAVFTHIIKNLSVEPDNRYMASSLFKDIYEEIKPVMEYLNIKVPEPDLYKGEEYFAPFAEGLLKISKKI